MSLVSLCQRCGTNREHAWNVHQAELHVGGIVYWKVQLCSECTKAVEQAVLQALRPPIVECTWNHSGGITPGRLPPQCPDIG